MVLNYGNYVLKRGLKKEKRGVPQRCVLGPLLFLIYFNDFFQLPLKSRPYGLADDTTRWAGKRFYLRVLEPRMCLDTQDHNYCFDFVIFWSLKNLCVCLSHVTNHRYFLIIQITGTFWCYKFPGLCDFPQFPRTLWPNLKNLCLSHRHKSHILFDVTNHRDFTPLQITGTFCGISKIPAALWSNLEGLFVCLS